MTLGDDEWRSSRTCSSGSKRRSSHRGGPGSRSPWAGSYAAAPCVAVSPLASALTSAPCSRRKSRHFQNLGFLAGNLVGGGVSTPIPQATIKGVHWSTFPAVGSAPNSEAGAGREIRRGRGHQEGVAPSNANNPGPPLPRVRRAFVGPEGDELPDEVETADAARGPAETGRPRLRRAGKLAHPTQGVQGGEAGTLVVGIRAGADKFQSSSKWPFSTARTAATSAFARPLV